MGGVLILLGLFSGILLWGDLSNYHIWFLLFIVSGFGLLGAYDDYKKIKFKLMINKTLTKNMPNVKWDQLPPLRGPNPQGELNGKTIRRSDKQMVTSKKVTKKTI